MDLRLKTLPFEYGGHTLQLCCNFNVLADLQAAGELDEMLDEKRSFRNFTRLLAALVNEDTVVLRRLYPEWGAQTRLPYFAHGTLLWYCTQHGLFAQPIDTRKT